MDDSGISRTAVDGFGMAQVIHPDQVGVAKLAKTVAEMLERSVPEHDLMMNGAEQTRKFIASAVSH